MLNEAITYGFLKALNGLRYGQFVIVTPDGKRHEFAGPQPGPLAQMKLHDWCVVPNLIRRGDIGFAEDYREGRWDSQDLTALIACSLQNEAALDKYIYGNMFSMLAVRLSYLFKRNSKSGSRENIKAHYDLGNDFYQLWLDPSMTYSAALFPVANDNLTLAQYNKYDRIINHLGVDSGKILEIGCGWGGFAERALEKGDYDIKGLTLSREQHQYAEQRLQQKATFALQDYRDEIEQYDSIVSIEMFEAVGEAYWPIYFRKLAALLKDKGRAVVQTITINEQYFDRYRRSGDMIRSFIFPGGMLPSVSRFRHEAAKAGLRIEDQFAFGQDYARTLHCWLKAFDAVKAEVQSLGFNDKFIRLWRLYLAVCEASFQVGRTDVMQLRLSHA